jgi:hypothetical protein
LGNHIISEKANQGLNNYFTVIYDNEVGPKGAQIIDEIVNQTLKMNSTEEKLNYISKKICENFTNPYWIEDFSYWDINPLSKGYLYDLNGNLRLLQSSKYYNDPKWIAYYKTGACGELAILFSEIANRSGYKTRTIHSEFPGGNHGWSEVLIDDEWWFFDPAVYADYQKEGSGEQYKWFNRTQNYPWFYGRMTKIIVVSTNEDRISEYPQPQKPQPKIPRFGDDNFGSILIEKYISPSLKLLTQKDEEWFLPDTITILPKPHSSSVRMSQ